jgi:NodT family efflux transporter outer membrane factor (OMF) lipoprotein
MRHLLLTTLTLVALTVSGCAAFRTTPPRASVAASGAFQETSSEVSTSDAPAKWWRLFDDPVLDAHVERALAANTDLRMAAANLKSARALAGQAHGAQWPATVIESGAGPDPANSQPSTSSVPKTSYELGFTLAYEVDLFGRVDSAVRAARADADAVQATYQTVRIAVVADTVTAYADLCAASRNQQLMQAQIDAATRYRDLIATQLRLGETSPLELSQASAALEQAKAARFVADTDRRRALYSLAALEGLSPAQAASLDQPCLSLPHITTPLPVGDAGSLLARRPDVREAERKLAAATARADTARADLYPRIRIGASAGDIAGSSNSILTPLVTWNFPNQSIERARINAAKGTAEAALAKFDGVILQALRETETVLADYRNEKARNESLKTALSESELALTRAQARQRIGEDSHLPVFIAQRARNAAEAEAMASDLKIIRNQIALFKALGGGWQAMDAAPDVK